MKKLLSLLLTAILVLGAVPFGMFTASADFIVDDSGSSGGGFVDNNVEVEDTLIDPVFPELEVTMQDDLTKVENLEATISDENKNIIRGWGNTPTKGEPLAFYTTYTSGTTVDKMFQSSTANVTKMTNGDFNDTHGDLSGGHQWFNANKEWVKGHIDMTFNFPTAASITNFLFAATKETADRRTWEYQVFAGNELATLYTDDNLLYHYNEGGANTPTEGQYISFSKPVEAKYFGVRILKGCNPNSADSNRSYSWPRIREVAIIGSCVIPDEYKATASKWVNPCLEALDTEYNLLNGADYTAGDGSAGTIKVTGFDGTKAVSASIGSYNPDACDLVDHQYTKLHADINGFSFMNADGTYKEGAYFELTVALLHEAVIDKFFISHATSNNWGLRTYEYEVYVGDTLETLYAEGNKKWHFINENAVQHQVYEFPEPVTAKYVGIKILKGVMPDCTLPSGSCSRIAEIALFGEYNTEYYDYSVTSGETGLVSANGKTYSGKNLTFSAPICKDGYTFRGWKINGENVEDYTSDIFENITEITVTLTEDMDIEVVYVPDDVEFTSNDTYTVSADKTQIRVPVHTVLNDAKFGFEQFHTNISAMNGDTALADKDFLKKGYDLILSSNGVEKQRLSVVIAGDFDNNGDVKVSDVVAGIDAIIDGKTTADSFFRFDVNNSGSLTVSDVVKTRKTILTTPAEETDYVTATTPMKNLDYKTQGRYVVKDDGSVIFDWTAAGFSFNADLYGDVVLNLQQGPNDSRWYTVVVDGVEQDLKISGNTKQDVVIAKNLPSGVHSIGFYKQQEGGNNITVNSLTINGKVLKSDDQGDLLIEFIGDSITCGAGNKVKDGEHLSGHYEDGYNAYGTVTARLLDADWSNISVSGSSLIDDRDREPTRYHMPTEYSHAIKGKSSTQSDYEWNFETNRNADIVVINLGTNDNGFISIYSGIDTNKKVAYFKDLAVAFAKQIIKANGEDVKIIFAFGLMTSTPNFVDEAYQQAITELAAGGYNNAFYCRLPTDQTGGVGHPTVAGDLAAAKVLSEFIKTEVLK